MLMDLLYIVVGLAALTYAGDKLVDFAVATAHRARLTPAVIGLTVVSAGTSAPELFVSLTATLDGSPQIALANVVGSNIANVALVLGACAAVAAIPISRGILRFEYPFMILASWIALLLSRDLLLDRLESGFFFASLVAFVGYAVWLARQDASAREASSLTESSGGENRFARLSASLLAMGLLGALIGLGVGARLLVYGAEGIAEGLGVSERVIGLTVVAVGTSLPELVATIAAAVKKQHEMAVTNVVGSNIFNLLLILGVTGLVQPIRIEPRFISLDMWVMLGISLLLLPVVVKSARMSRRSGWAFLALYTSYILLIGTGH